VSATGGEGVGGARGEADGSWRWLDVVVIRSEKGWKSCDVGGGDAMTKELAGGWWPMADGVAFGGCWLVTSCRRRDTIKVGAVILGSGLRDREAEGVSPQLSRDALKLEAGVSGEKCACGLGPRFRTSAEGRCWVQVAVGGGRRVFCFSGSGCRLESSAES